MVASFDLAVIGSGFAGTLLARAVRASGQEVVVLERGHHPRFALGESTTPLAGFALERLAHRYGLPDLRSLSTHGRWLANLPQLRRGLKRGFTFYQHHRGEPYRNSPANDSRLLVAASPDDHLADTHWLRQDVDHHLVRRAVAEGVDLREGTEVLAVETEGSGFVLHLRNAAGRSIVHARTVVDASGPAGVLPRSFGLEPIDVPLSSGLLFAHFTGVTPFVDLARETADLSAGPYADENAAVHHLLDIGWLYALPFDHDVVSAGLVLRHDRQHSGLSSEQLASDPRAAWRELLEPFPTLARQLADARPLGEIRYLPRIQHRLDWAAGPDWFLLPHTFAFFDPLFSTGIAWSLLAVERLADLLTGGWGSWQEYNQLLRLEAEQIERLISAAYQGMDDFSLFRAVSFLYFATVSFQEVRQRLLEPVPDSRPFAWEGFLGAGEPRLRSLYRETLQRLQQHPGQSSEAVERWIEEQIAPWNIAGLADPERRNLYPLDLDVLVDRSHLLGLDRETVVAALPRLRGDEEPVVSAR